MSMDRLVLSDFLKERGVLSGYTRNTLFSGAPEPGHEDKWISGYFFFSEAPEGPMFWERISAEWEALVYEARDKGIPVGPGGPMYDDLALAVALEEEKRGQG